MCFPTTIRLWNKLPTNTRTLPNLESFKEQITPKIIRPPTYYSYGDRREQVLHARLRAGNVDLQ